MAYIEPDTTIKFLVGVPFDPTYENTMYFANAAEQEAWMLNKVLYTFDKNSYQRVSRGRFKVGWVADALGSSVINQLYSSNYMMFKNTNFENKWFYAFVTNVEYVNNNTVEVSYVIDIVQTWLFQFRFNQCLIEREHTTTDVAGQNLLPENLEHGDYMVEVLEKVAYTPVCVIVTTFDPLSYDPTSTPPWSYNGGYVAYGRVAPGPTGNGNMFTGCHYIAYDLSDATRISALNTFLEQVNEAGQIDGVVGMFMMPGEFFTEDGTVRSSIIKTYSRNATMDNYTPRNKKLLTWPYNGLYVTNMLGASRVYEYEYFNSPSDIIFSIWGNMSANPGMIAIPVGYKVVNLAENPDECISLTGFPLCAWTNDTFRAWVAQNSGTILASYIGAGIGAATALAQTAAPLLGGLDYTRDVVASPSPYGGAGIGRQALTAFGMGVESTPGLRKSGVAGLAGAVALLGQVHDHSIKPPTSHGAGNGNLIYQSGLMTFVFMRKYIRSEFATIIDSFFDMYGYATHRVGLPNLNARPCYSYVKTVGASIDGLLPASVCSELEGVFNKGIRFWKPSAVFGSFDPGVNDNRV